MPPIDRGSNSSILSSDWTGLSRFLIAKFYPVERIVEGESVRWQRVADSVEVHAPITDGVLDNTATWHSPFENQTADARISSLSSMLQIGGFAVIANALQQAAERNGIPIGGALKQGSDQLATLEGRSAVTKLNSTQVFSGMPPMKVTLTAHFRALRDAASEVSAPMDQLVAWTLPKRLAPQGIVGNALSSSHGGVLRTIYPSEAPQIIGMEYADMLILPLVIEANPRPLTGPRDKDGRLICAQLTMTMGSLTAIDKDDWAAMRRR